MKQITVFVLSVFFIFIQSTNAQNNKTIYAEGLGNAAFYSLNYDMRFTKSIKGPGGRIGLGVYASGQGAVFSAPIMLNYLIGKEKHFLELGAGVTYINGATNFIGDYDFDTGFGLTLGVMYRLQTPGGFLFRIGLTPLFADDVTLPTWAGIAFGYSF